VLTTQQSNAAMRAARLTSTACYLTFHRQPNTTHAPELFGGGCRGGAIAGDQTG
jgi:hypothetical protein